jgi:hypothetical protein
MPRDDALDDPNRPVKLLMPVFHGAGPVTYDDGSVHEAKPDPKRTRTDGEMERERRQAEAAFAGRGSPSNPPEPGYSNSGYSNKPDGVNDGVNDVNDVNAPVNAPADEWNAKQEREAARKKRLEDRLRGINPDDLAMSDTPPGRRRHWMS